MLLAQSEPSKIRWALADFYDAVIDAQLPEATRLAGTIETVVARHLGRPHERHHQCPHRRDSTGSSSRPSGSAAATGT